MGSRATWAISGHLATWQVLSYSTNLEVWHGGAQFPRWLPVTNLVTVQHGIPKSQRDFCNDNISVCFRFPVGFGQTGCYGAAYSHPKNIEKHHRMEATWVIEVLLVQLW